MPKPAPSPQPELATPPLRDPLPPLAREVLALFAGPLAEVRFPDLDGAALEAMAERVRDQQRELERIEAALEAVHGALREQVAALDTRAERALAYARVFAEGDPELSARVAEIGRKKPSPTKPSATRARRTRRTREQTEVADADLFGPEDAAAQPESRAEADDAAA